MTTLSRSDGMQFVVQAYREHLPLTSRSHLIRIIRNLSDQHGHYLFLTKKSNQEIEAVLSKETGYLLGEAIWSYFACPENLIYVENLPEDNQLLLVVIRNNSVLIDAKIPEENLQEELFPLISAGQVYQVRIFGDVVLKFPDALISSYERVPQSIFQKIQARPDFTLRPLPLALKSPALGKNHLPILILGILTVSVLAGFTFFHSGRPVLSEMQPIARAVNPYAEYEKALSTSEPSEQISSFVEVMKTLYFIPGWKVSSFKLENQEYQIRLESEGGSLESLLNWSRENHFNLNITGQSVILKQKISLKKRQAPTNIYSLNQVVSLLVDELDELLNAKVIELGDAEEHGGAASTPMKINLNKTSPEIIDLLGREIEHLPLELKSVDISFKDGLVDGYIQLAVWGRKNANG